MSAQYDTTDRTFDVRNKIRTLWQKSNQNLADNIVAVPILDKKDAQKRILPFAQANEQYYKSTVIADDGASTYLLLNNVVVKDDESIKVLVHQTLKTKTYTAKDIKESGNFMIGPFRGDYSLHVHSDQAPEWIVKQVYASPVNHVAMELGFDASFTCHNNVNCEQGTAVAEEKRAVMRIRMVAEEGVALCTGTLLNNTMGDRRPLVLTAFHCLEPPSGSITPLYDMWWFDFNYESFSCANPEEEPFVTAIQGATPLAGWEETDMMLVEIANEIPESANVYYAGWNRELDYEPDTTYLIHHPVGDIKKISFDYDTALIHDQTIGWNNSVTSPRQSHYINDFDESTYQPGSSGASIFDKNGSVIGQLHGGPLSDEFCSIGIGYSGRLSLSWDAGNGPGTRLKDWLDPIRSNATVIPGINPKQNEFVRFEGQLRTPDGLSIPNVRVSLSGDMDASFLTGADGGFVFENLDPEGAYSITFEKNTQPGNGVSAVDLILIRNHILERRPLGNEFLERAADVNADARVSSLDLVQIVNVILQRASTFPSSPSWRFSPATLEMTPGNMGAGNVQTTIFGYKMGDVNFDSNPRE